MCKYILTYTSSSHLPVWELLILEWHDSKCVQWIYLPAPAVPLSLGDLTHPEKMSTAQSMGPVSSWSRLRGVKPGQGNNGRHCSSQSFSGPSPSMETVTGLFPVWDQALNSPIEMLLLRTEAIILVKTALFPHWLDWNHSLPWAHGWVEIRIEKLKQQVIDPCWKHPVKLKFLPTQINCIDKHEKRWKTQLSLEKLLYFLCIIAKWFSNLWFWSHTKNLNSHGLCHCLLLDKLGNVTSLLSLLLKSLSRVRLFATPWTVARQALPSMGFSRQEYWSGLPFPFSRGSSRPRGWTQVSRIPGWCFNLWATREDSKAICKFKLPTRSLFHLGVLWR